MKEFIIKDGTHVVLKEDDIQIHLSEVEANILSMLYEKIIRGRKGLGKPENKYHVVNCDEPYAEQVLDIIRIGEGMKDEVDPNQIGMFDDLVAGV